MRPRGTSSPAAATPRQHGDRAAAGRVSTKTLYRLIPNKERCSKALVSDRLDALSRRSPSCRGDIDIEEALCAALIACGRSCA